VRKRIVTGRGAEKSSEVKKGGGKRQCVIKESFPGPALEGRRRISEDLGRGGVLKRGSGRGGVERENPRIGGAAGGNLLVISDQQQQEK